MVNYQEARVKIKNMQLNKLQYAAKKKKTGKLLRLSKKNFKDEELQH